MRIAFLTPALARRSPDRPAVFLASGLAREVLLALTGPLGAGSRTPSRLLRAELGMTFYEWRTQLRIYHALVLLADGHDTTRTDSACGWSDPSSFIAAFTDIIGTIPGRYRAGRRGAARGS
ncbi:helix-turn-helix domain-containing protein [Nocardia sp. NPDC050193]